MRYHHDAPRPLPVRYGHIWKSHATFRWTVVVAGDEVLPVKRQLLITWDGERPSLKVVDAGAPAT